MTDKRQSDALHLAGIADDGAWTFVIGVRKEIAAELRRQSAEIETLHMGYAAARLEIESLKSQSAAQRWNPMENGNSETALQMAAVIAHRDAALPDAPLPVFSKGPWTFKETGQSFSGAELDEAAFVAYRDRASREQAPASTSGDFIRRTNEDYAAWCATKYTPEFNSKGPDLHGLWAWQEQQRRMDDLLRQAPINLNCKSEQKRRATLWGFVPAQAAPAAVAGPSLYQVMAVAKAIHATTPDADDWDSLRQCEVDALRGRAEKVLAALAAAPTTQPAPQQEAQEPAAVVVPCHTPSGKRVALYSAKQDLPIGTQLYTAPQPSPAAQVDALESEYQRGYRQGYEQRDAEVRGALV